MDTFVINKFLNNRFAYSLSIVLYVFIFYLIFEHIFDLTKLVIQYNSEFDYGKNSKKVCSNEFFEYETERFHVNENADEMKLSNTANKKKYLTLILVLAIIMTLFISFVFSYIIFNTFLNKDWLYNLLDIQSDAFEKRLKYNDESLFQKGLAYAIHIFTLLFSPFKIISGLFYKLFITKENGGSFLMNILLFTIVTIIYLLIAAVIVTMPIYIGLKMNLDIDISPFNSNHQVFIPYIVAFVCIILIRLSFMYFKYSETYIDNYNPVTEYFSSNVDKMYTGNNFAGYLGFFAVFAIYILMFYLLGNIINLHSNKTKDNDESKDDDKNSESIMNVFLGRTFGYKEFNNFQLSNIFLKKLSGISFTMIIVILVMIFVYYLITISGGNENVQRLIKYGIITPFAFLTIPILASTTTTEFNTIVNDYILEYPYKLYKQYIDLINRKFNKVIVDEYASSKDVKSHYICRNVGNAIYITLFNELFYGVSKLDRTGQEGGKLIDITPELKYDKICENKESFNFTQDYEYDLSYYINGKKLKKNIFYNYNKCSQINTKVLETVMSNLQIFSENELAQFMKEIQQVFYSPKPLETEDPVQYINLKIVKKNKEANIKIENLRYELKRKIHKCIHNVKNNLTCTNKEKQIIFSENSKYYQNDEIVDLSDSEVHYHNNEIGGDLAKASAEQVFEEYDNIVDDIIEIYLEIVYHHLYVFTPFFVKLNINKNTKGISKDDDKYQELQEVYIKKLIQGMSKTFEKINQKLSMPLLEGSSKILTEYIITNYNSIHVDKIYKKELLYQIEKTNKLDEDDTENPEKINNIKIFREILDSFISIYKDNVQSLSMALKTNDYKNIKFIVNMERTRGNITNIREELNQYKYDTSFNSDINSIFRNDESKYNISYEIFNVKTEKTNIVNIDNAFDTLDKMMELTNFFIDDMEMIYTLFMQPNLINQKLKNIEKYKENVRKYENIIETNNYALLNDITNYENSVSNKINSTVDFSDITIDLSRNTLKESKEVDKLIYMVCVNYLISIILTNFIYNI